MTVRDGKLTVWGIFGKVILGSFGVYIVFTFVCLRDNEPRSTHSFAMGIIATTSQLCALFAETHSWKSIHVRSVHTCYMYISICKYVHIYMYIIYITTHSHTHIYIYIWEEKPANCPSFQCLRVEIRKQCDFLRWNPTATRSAEGVALRKMVTKAIDLVGFNGNWYELMDFKAYTVPLLTYQNPLDPFFGTNFNLNKLDADSNRCAGQKKAKKHKKGFPKRRSWMKDRSMT